MLRISEGLRRQLGWTARVQAERAAQTALKAGATWLKEEAERRFFASVTIHSDDDSFNWVISWLGQQPQLQSARQARVHTLPVPIDDNGEYVPALERQRRTATVFAPGTGMHRLRYKGSLVWINRVQDEKYASKERLEIRMVARDAALLKELLQDARDLALTVEPSGVRVSVAQSSYWISTGTQPARKEGSVILPGDQYDRLVHDLTTFLSQRHRYTDLGIPFRRGYLFYGPPGTGKCLARGTLVMLADGSVKAVEDIATGEQVMGPDSRPRTVLGTTSGQELLYTVTPVKGDPYTVNESHILSLKMSGTGYGYQHGEVVNISVREYLALRPQVRERLKGYRVGVDFPAQPVDLDPYFLGVWLGDGDQGRPTITTPDPAVAEAIYTTAAQTGLRVRVEDPARCPRYAITAGPNPGGIPRGGRNAVLTFLQEHRLTQAKHIPTTYLRNSRDVRLQLLAGLMDTDGCLASGGYDFISKSRQLADDLVYLCRSLGFAAYLRPAVKKATNATRPQHMAEGAVYYRVSISGDLSVVPVRVPRRVAPPRRQIKDVLVTGITVEPVGVDDYYGFELDGDGLFLLGDFTVTHNTSSIMALASTFGLHLYILNLSAPNLDDSGLMELLSNVREGSAILMEDVDALWSRRRRRDDNASHVSFSGLLNALDGVAASQGRLVFMTTNHVDQLDPALIRPGRVDYRLEFGPATPDQAARLFTRFYNEHDYDPDLATQFAAAGATGETVMCELQEFLLGYFDDPAGAAREIATYVPLARQRPPTKPRTTKSAKETS